MQWVANATPLLASSSQTEWSGPAWATLCAGPLFAHARMPALCPLSGEKRTRATESRCLKVPSKSGRVDKKPGGGGWVRGLHARVGANGVYVLIGRDPQ